MLHSCEKEIGADSFAFSATVWSPKFSESQEISEILELVWEPLQVVSEWHEDENVENFSYGILRDRPKTGLPEEGRPLLTCMKSMLERVVQNRQRKVCNASTK